MNYGDLNAALQRLLRWGSPNMPGLEQLLKQLREARERELGRYNLDSTVEQLREKVQEVVDTEKKGIERRLNESPTPEAKKLMERIARQRNEQLDRLPDDLGGQVRRCAITSLSTTRRVRSSKSSCRACRSRWSTRCSRA